jgi:hypothetical protein
MTPPREPRVHGRVLDSPGDNLLAEFPTATDALECAVEIQRATSARNATTRAAAAANLPVARRTRIPRARDPARSHAWLGLAWYGLTNTVYAVPDLEGMPRAKSAALRATPGKEEVFGGPSRPFAELELLPSWDH